MKKIFMFLMVAVMAVLFTGCLESSADVASRNLSRAAEEFEINRRVVFYNGITDEQILIIEGRCSVDFYTDKFVVTVRTGEKEYKKHYLGRADNVFPFVEQLDAAKTNTYHYRVIMRPSTLIPTIEIK